MRVGLVTGEYPPMQGGVGDFTRQLGQALARLGVETHVVTSRRAAASGPAGVSVYPVINHWSFVSLWRMRALARRLELDLLNLQYQAAAYELSAPIHFLPRWAGLSLSQSRQPALGRRYAPGAHRSRRHRHQPR